jgi:hypothetical protein
MKNVAKIINARGGIRKLAQTPLKIEAAGFMPLCIEVIGVGPNSLPLVSVAHYGEQNGDLMRDPDMVFEVGDLREPDDLAYWSPISFRNAYVGLDQTAVWNEDGRILARPKLVKELATFARQWDRNLKAQGFVDAAMRQEVKS